MVFVNAGIVLVISILVMIGWFFHIPALVQVLPNLVPMQFNTALALFLCSISLLAFSKERWLIVFLSSALVTLLGALTLGQYIWSIDFGIDELFINADIVIGTSHPGRMAPNSALSFILTSLAISGLSFCKPDNNISQFATLCLILLVLALSMLSTLGYLLQVEPAYGWGRYTQMALHTSVSFLILAIALLFLVTQTFSGKKYLILAGGAFAAVLAIDIIIPLGIAVGVAYVPLVLCCLPFKQKHAPILTAIFATLLVILGLVASAGNESSTTILQTLPIFNRIFSVVAIWVVAVAVYLFLKKERETIEYKENLELALESASLSPWVWDLKTGKIDLSETVGKRLGYEQDELPKTIKGWRSLIQPDDNQRTEQDIQSCIDGHTLKFETQFRVKHKEGQWVVLRSIGKVTEKSVLGAPAIVTGIHEDITEKVRKDEQLLLLETAMNHSLDALIITDANTESPSIVYASRSNETLSGYKPEELIGKNPNILQGPKHKDGAQLDTRQAIRSALNNQDIFNGEIINVSKDGREYWVRLTIFPVKNKEGKVTHFGSIGTDITREKEFQDLLQVEHEQFQTAIESSPIGIALVSLEGKWLTVNSALSDMFGVTSEELSRCELDELVHPDYLEADLPYLEPLFKGDIPSYTIEKKYISKNGDEFWGLSTVSLVRDRDGQPLHFISQLQDINSRKQHENKIKDYMAALETSNRELDDFAYIASHDLKEPLRGINNHAQSLIKLYGNKLDDRAQKKLIRLATLSEKMERLISDLLYFSRIGRSESAIEEVNVQSLIEEEITLLEKTLEEDKCNINIQSDLPILKTSKFKASIVFRNIIANGLKYNESNPKTIEISFTPEFSLAGKTISNVFHIKDNGIGIDPMFHDRIFKMFKKLNNETSFGGGTGAGLAFVDKILTQMGGIIWVTSELGKGSTFHFSFEGESND